MKKSTKYYDHYRDQERLSDLFSTTVIKNRVNVSLFRLSGMALYHTVLTTQASPDASVFCLRILFIWLTLHKEASFPPFSSGTHSFCSGCLCVYLKLSLIVSICSGLIFYHRQCFLKGLL